MCFVGPCGQLKTVQKFTDVRTAKKTFFKLMFLNISEKKMFVFTVKKHVFLNVVCRAMRTTKSNILSTINLKYMIFCRNKGPPVIGGKKMPESICVGI